jgi:Uma2 family endonuclease
MTAAAISPILVDAVQRRAQIIPFTVKQYDALIELGEIAEDTATELIDGFIVKKDRSAVGEDPLTIGDRHSTAVSYLVELNPNCKRLGCFIRVQLPIWIPPINEPEPDLCVVVGTIEDYRSKKPALGEITSVIEVADNSLHRDLGSKLQMYAKGKMPEYIVVNLVDDVVLVHSKPSRGKYPKPKVRRRGDKLKISAGNGRSVEIEVAKLLGI